MPGGEQLTLSQRHREQIIVKLWNKKTLTIENINQLENDITQIFIIILPKLDIPRKEAKMIKAANGVEIKEFSFYLIPLDLDVLSLEFLDTFRGLRINQDLSIYNYVADSIINQNKLFMNQKQYFILKDQINYCSKTSDNNLYQQNLNYDGQYTKLYCK